MIYRVLNPVPVSRSVEGKKNKASQNLLPVPRDLGEKLQAAPVPLQRLSTAPWACTSAADSSEGSTLQPISRTLAFLGPSASSARGDEGASLWGNL